MGRYFEFDRERRMTSLRKWQMRLRDAPSEMWSFVLTRVSVAFGRRAPSALRLNKVLAEKVYSLFFVVDILIK